MLISHEAPLALMPFIRPALDYDYALVHRLTNRKYLKYFEHSIKIGRKVILDNSLFELGEAFDSTEYIRWIDTLNPSEVIAPDVFNGGSKNVLSFKLFKNQFEQRLRSAKLIGVIHAPTENELFDQAVSFSTMIDKIAIPFGSKAFEHSLSTEKYCSPNLSEKLKDDLLFRKSVNRFIFIKERLIPKMLQSRPKIRFHLLGLYYPYEYQLYNEFLGPKERVFIETVDTSHPVAHALESGKYSAHDDGILFMKPSLKIDANFDRKFSFKDLYNTLYNINTFKRYVK